MELKEIFHFQNEIITMTLFCFLIFIFSCYFISNSIICHNIIIHVSNDNGIWMYLKCAYEPLNDFLMTLISCTTHFLCKMRFMTTDLYTNHQDLCKNLHFIERHTPVNMWMQGINRI